MILDSTLENCFGQTLEVKYIPCRFLYTQNKNISRLYFIFFQKIRHCANCQQQIKCSLSMLVIRSLILVLWDFCGDIGRLQVKRIWPSLIFHFVLILIVL